MNLLIVNANTSEAVTSLVACAARGFVSPGTTLTVATAHFGARIIASRTEAAIAQHAVLDLLARHGDACDGALIAASYDSGLFAAREFLGKPVAGLTEASLLAASTLGARIGLVIWGKGAFAVYHEMIEAYGLAKRICGTVRLDVAPAEGPADAERFEQAAAEAARSLVQTQEADVIVLVGAVFAGRSPAIEFRVGAPVLDGVRCGVPLLEALVRMAPARPSRGSFALPPGRETSGLSPDLQRRLTI